jgi:NTP pyrophosphatase (non-canonical NTP hydrolase)
MTESNESLYPNLSDFDTYQQLARATAIYPSIGGGEVYPALGLANEAGEVLGRVKKVYRDKNGEYDGADLEAIEAELGDVLWYVSQIAAELKLSLRDIAEYNVAKLRSRQQRGVLAGNGDDR